MGSRVVSFVFNEFSSDIRVLKQNRTLKAAGYEPIVVATQDPRFPKRETRDGFEVRRLWIPLGLPLAFQLIVWWIQCLWLYRDERLLHCNDLYALPIGVAIKVLFRHTDARELYDAHEHETEAHVYAGKPLLKFVARQVERALIHHVDQVVTVSRPIAEEYSRLYGIPTPRLVLNCPSKFAPGRRYDLFREKFGIPADTRIILYQGEYRQGRGIEAFVDALVSYPGQKVVGVFLGYGSYTQPVEEGVRRAPGRVFMHPAVGTDVFMNYVCSADFGIHLMENTCLNHYYALPNKMFEYAMAGIPVVVSNMLEMGRLVREYDIGIVVEDDSPEALHRVFDRVANYDTQAVRPRLAAFAEEYCWETQEREFLAVYEDLKR